MAELLTPEAQADSQRRVERAFARCFRGPDGDLVLAHLKTSTLERALGPNASDAALRHLEGQRQLFVTIRTLIERGRHGHPPDVLDDQE